MLSRTTKLSLLTLLKCGAAASALVFGTAGVADADAAAAASGGNQLEEIVVTARRTEENLQDVPISVSAFGAKKMEALGIIDATKLSNYTPGFEFTDYTNGRNGRGTLRYILFRGLYLSNNNLLSSAALVFQDGAPVLSGEVLINKGIERVEVLKGPQNVYFGRSTFAGAINYVTKNPGSDWKANTLLEAGNFNTYKAAAHVEGPLMGDTVTFALDGLLAHKGGQYTSYAEPSLKLGVRDTASISGTLYAKPSDNLSIKLFGNFSQYRDGQGISVLVPSTVAANCHPGGTLDRAGGVITGAVLRNSYHCGSIKVPKQYITQYANFDAVAANALFNPAPGYGGKLVDCGKLYGLCARNYALHGIVNYTAPNGISFNSIAAWHKRPVGEIADAFLQDTSRLPNPNFGNPAFPTAPRTQTFKYNIQAITEDYSIEGRLSSNPEQSLRWTFGANYVDAKNETQLFFYNNTGASPNPVNYHNPYQTAKTIGVFGGLYYEPVDGLILSAEGRWQQDKISAHAVTGAAFAEKYTAVTPRFSVTYQVNDDINLYASYATGVRPGGFNQGVAVYPPALLAAIAAQVGSAPVAYDQEKMWQAEVGVKGRFFDNTVQANVAAYVGKLTKWQQGQTAFVNPPDPLFGARFDLITNSGAVKLSGLEADGQWLVNDILTLSGTFAYTKTSIEGSNCFLCYTITGSTNIDGKRLQGTPLYAGSVSADLEDKLTSSLNWFVHADVVYKGNRWNDFVNLYGTGSSTLVNAAIGIKAEAWTATIFGTNILNDKTITAGAASNDFNTGSALGAVRAGLPDRPQVGIRLEHDF
jgi:iron complex outermembrane receptor protein